MTSTVVLPQVPALGGLYARGLAAGVRLAAERRSGTAPAGLPDVAYEVHGVPVAPARLAAYQALLGLRATDRLPAGFVHVLAFPLHMAVMARRDFPLPPVGMVHVANRVTQRAPLFRDDRLDLAVRATGLRPHRSGTQIDLVAQARRAGSPEIAWEAVSTYLSRDTRLLLPPAPPTAASERRGAGGSLPSDVGEQEPATSERGGGRGSPSSDVGGEEGSVGGEGRVVFVPPVPTGVWRLAGDTGRRYAEVSGDRNPVHLSAVTARPFGFRRAIAHGMYTAARALADVGPAAGHRFVWTAEFGKPVELPATVSVRVAADGDGFAYTAWRPGARRPYLTGAVHPLR